MRSLSRRMWGFTGTGIVLGKHSGRHALAQRLAELGYPNISPVEIDKVNARFKELADKKRTCSTMI